MDQYDVKLLSRTLRDLDGIYGYIAKTLQEPAIVLDLVNEIETQILSLEQIPYRCPERRTGACTKKGYRQLFVKSYAIIYRIDEARKQVTVVTAKAAFKKTGGEAFPSGFLIRLLSSYGKPGRSQ